MGRADKFANWTRDECLHDRLDLKQFAHIANKNALLTNNTNENYKSYERKHVHLKHIEN